MNFDFYNGGTLADVVTIKCFFNGLNACYWGWMYNSNGDIIGDFNTTDSVEIEKTFGYCFSF